MELWIKFEEYRKKMKQHIEELLKSTNREGIENVIDFLNESDFYTAPASSKYHGSCKEGLAKHSLSVYNMMNELVQKYKLEFKNDSVIIVGLLHDICKVGKYKPNILKSGEQSEAKPYTLNKELTLGHGEKSLIVLLQLGLKMSNEEMIAIRWHMNAFDDISHYKASSSWNKLSILCFIADYFSSQFLEV